MRVKITQHNYPEYVGQVGTVIDWHNGYPVVLFCDGINMLVSHENYVILPERKRTMIKTLILSGLTIGALSFGGAATVPGGVVGPELPAETSNSVTGEAGSASLPEVSEDRPAPTTDRSPVPVPVNPSVLPEVPPVTVPEPVEYVVPVSCPQEDTCRLDYTSDAQWILYYGETYTPDRVFSVVLPVTCPSEDSCAADYRGDLTAWVITENAPH